MRVEGGAKTANLARALNGIREAADGGANIVVLPEAMNLGWTHPSCLTEAEEIPGGETCSMLRRAAVANRVYVCAGLVERAGPRVFNSAVLIDPAGEIVLLHRKINELDIGHPFYALGDRLQVAETPFGRVGLMICADAFARGQVLSRALGYMGAELVLSPSAWAVPAGHDNLAEPYGSLWMENYAPVARDFGLWIAGVSCVGVITDGPWRGRKCIGCSLIVDPDGHAVVRGPYGENAEAILRAEIQLRPPPVQGASWAAHWQGAPE